MITSLKLKNVASYDAIGAEINTLKKVNYFFGFNGSGKSTIAKYLYALSQNNLEHFNSCYQDGYDSAKAEILVFDDKFIKRNFTENNSLQGIFSLNEKNAEIDKQIQNNSTFIDTNNNKISKSKDCVAEIIDTIKKDKDQLLDKCFEKRRTFATFAKIGLEHAKSKQNNYECIRQILSNDTPIKEDLDILSNTYKKLYEQELQIINTRIDINLFISIQETEEESNKLLNEIIVGKDDVPIGQMIKEFELKSWVEEGKDFLSQTGKTCPFCQNETIDDNFISQLNAYFDESYLRKKENLKSKKASFETKVQSLLNNIEEVSKEYNQQNCSTDILQNITTYLHNASAIFNSKIKAPNEKYVIDCLFVDNKNRAETINRNIDENNQFVQEKENSKKNLKSTISNYIAIECKDEIERAKKIERENSEKKEKEEKKIETLRTEIDRITEDNKILQGKTVNTKKAVTAINDMLKNSGFVGFSIEEKTIENNISQYYLKRTNSSKTDDIFSTLSEGEKKFISFLYFYQICLGRLDHDASNTKKKVIVIDDPVSSMDSQVLFIVSSLINSLIQKKSNANDQFNMSELEQVFILTHNFYFYKEISIRARPVCNNKIHYRIKKSSDNITSIELNRENSDILDDYRIMWKSITELKKQISEDKKNNIFLANTFRRILESYTNFIGLGHDSWASITIDDDKSSVEYLLKCAFISQINDDSHKITPFDSYYFQKIHNETPQKLFEVFESIFNKIGKDHYNMMIKQ